MRLAEPLKQNTVESFFRIWEGFVAGLFRLNRLAVMSLDWRKCGDEWGQGLRAAGPAWARATVIWRLFFFWLPMKITIAVIRGAFDGPRYNALTSFSPVATGSGQ